MQYLKVDVANTVTIGPAVAVGDGFTPVTNLVGASADEYELIKHGATTTTPISAALSAITGADGYYSLVLSAGECSDEGRLTLLINDDSLILPIRHEFMVVAANVYDSLFAVAGTDLLQVDQTQIVGGAVPTPTTTGVPDVNVERWLDTLVTLGAGAPDVNVQSMDAGSIASGVIAAAELTNIENEIWDALKSAHVVANSFGDFLDIEVSSRMAEASISTTGGAVDTVTTLTNLPSIPANWLTTAGITDGTFTAAKFAASSLDGKGDWNIGKTGYALSAAGVDAILDETLTAHVTVDSLAVAIKDTLVDTNELQGDWVNGGRLDLILDATALETTAGNIETDTQDIQARLPAALVSGRMSSDVVAISGGTESADRLQRTTLAIVTGTCAAGGSTTSIIASALDPTSAVDDQFKGRIITFDKDTTTTALRGQATDITGYTHATLTCTVTALTTAPASGDTFTIT